MTPPTKTVVLEVGEALRVKVADGVPVLEYFDTYMAEQNQADPWNTIAAGDEVFSTLDELRAFAAKHSTSAQLRAVPRPPE